MMTIPVYVLNERALMIQSRFPVKRWLDICHQRPFITIAYRPDFRGQNCPRPWQLRFYTNYFSDTATRCATLKNAEQAALRWMKELE